MKKLSEDIVESFTRRAWVVRERGPGKREKRANPGN